MTDKSKRTRSPSYPVFDLETAVERASEFYEMEGFNEALVEVAVQSWGLTPGGSAGSRAVAALLNYGIFDDEGSGEERVVFLTELGKTIVLDERENSTERDEALKKAVLQPSIFQKLWEKWGANLPSEANMRYFLIRDLGFNQKHVDKFINIFQSSIEFAGLLEENEGNSKVGPQVEGGRSINEKKSTRDEHLSSPGKKVQDSGDENYLNIPIPLICGSRATLNIPTPLSEVDFQHLTKLINAYLENMKPAIVREKDNINIE